MAILVGKRYLYLPRGAECIVTDTFPDRHRCIVEMITGQQLQEIPYHDLQEIVEPPIETALPPIAEVKTEEPINEVVVDEQKSDSSYPLRDRTFGRRHRGE